MKQSISDAVKRDLGNGKAVYIRNGFLYFDSIEIHKDRAVLLYKNKPIFTIELGKEVDFANGEVLTFIGGLDGRMRVKIV